VLHPPAVVAGLDDVAVVGETIEQGRGHLGVAEHRRSLGELQVGGDDDRGVLVEAADQVEQQLAAGLGERQVAQLVEDQEIEPDQLLCQSPRLGVVRLVVEAMPMACG